MGGLYHNPALLSTGEGYFLADFSYSPWFRSVVPDVNIYHGGIVKTIKENGVIGIDYTGFFLGTVTYLHASGGIKSREKPSEHVFAVRYSNQLSGKLALGGALKYIRSDLKMPKQEKVGNAVAGDIGINYRSKKLINPVNDISYSFGLAILNVGNKISYTYTSEKYFLPITLKLGAALTRRVTAKPAMAYFDIGIIYELEKLLVPSPPIYARDMYGNPIYSPNGSPVILAGQDPNVGVIKGMMGSFSDAPGGFKEEIRELVHKIGIEAKRVGGGKLHYALRAGYMYEHESKGIRHLCTFGGGMGFSRLQLNLAYYAPFEERHPLSETLMFSLTYKQSFSDFYKSRI